MREPTARALHAVLLAAVGLHLAFAVVRLPHSAWTKRSRLIASYERLGDIGYHVGRSWPRAAQVLRWLRANVPADRAVLWEGDWKGVIEFAPAVLYPRLLCDARAVSEGSKEFVGHSIARGTLPSGETGQLVLVATGNELSLRVR